MGAVDLKDPGLIIKRVHSITRHKGFDATKLVPWKILKKNSFLNCHCFCSLQYNDIALITLDSPVKYSSTVAPVCLYDDEGVNHDDKEATAIGWGNLSDGNFKSQIELERERCGFCFWMISWIAVQVVQELKFYKKLHFELSHRTIAEEVSEAEHQEASLIILSVRLLREKILAR